MTLTMYNYYLHIASIYLVNFKVSVPYKFRFVKLNASIIPYIGRFAYPFYVIFLQYKRSNPSSPMVTDEFAISYCGYF